MFWNLTLRLLQYIDGKDFDLKTFSNQTDNKIISELI